MVKHYREGKLEESLGFEGERVKSISETHRSHQKSESLVNCNQSKMSVKSAFGNGGGRSKSLFKRVHSVKSPAKKKAATTDKYSYAQGNYSSNTSESSYSSDEEPPPQKRPKKSQQRQSNGFTKNVKKKKSDSKRRRDKHLKKEEEEEEFVVESIVDTKKDKEGTRLFCVKWENYDSAENTWEPIENLEKCRDLIEEFMKLRRNNNNNNNNVQKKKIIINYITTDEDDDDDDQDESSDEDEEEDESDHRDRDDNLKSSVKKPEKPINGIVSQNGITFPDVSSIKASMISSAQKVVDVDVGQPSPSPATTPSCSELSDEYHSDDGKSLQDISNLGTYLKIPHTGNIFYIRIIDEGNGQLNWVYVDVNEPEPEKEIFYRCVVTEDLTGKDPKFVFGATTSVDGEKFCLVQFEGHSYVEVIPPEILFLRFPSLRKFFEVHCPNLFQKNTH